MAKTMLFNPYTGKPRDPRDIASDPEGKLIVDPDEPLRAASEIQITKCQFDEAWRGKCNAPATGQFCATHAAVKCCVCGEHATHTCDHTGQFVCGAPLCDGCQGHTDHSQPSGGWGFMNHSHRRKGGNHV